MEVTGGEDLILIGLGALSQRHPDIELYQISSKLRTIRSFSLSADDGGSWILNAGTLMKKIYFCMVRQLFRQTVMKRFPVDIALMPTLYMTST